MKNLLLLRHAKSSWDDADLPDVERPLTPRGKRDAHRIGEALKERGPRPDLVLCSTARRARQTIKAVARRADLDEEPQFTDTLYAASADDLMDIVRALPDGRKCALLVGHNPGFEDLLGRLTGEEMTMGTAALGCVALDVARWSGTKAGLGTIVYLLTPKLLEGEGAE
jgi:phosphohistidine phosphatase